MADSEILYLATAGGQGAFSFGDPSRVGSRQLRSDANVSHNITAYRGVPIIPGGGGGSKPVPLLSGFGSRAPGSIPRGAVIIRLRKLT